MSDNEPPAATFAPPTVRSAAPLPPPTLAAPPPPPPPPPTAAPPPPPALIPPPDVSVPAPAAPAPAAQPAAAPTPSPMGVPTLPTLPPSAPVAAQSTPGQLPQSTIDALSAAQPGDHLRRPVRQRRPWIVRYFFSRAAFIIIVLTFGGVGSALEYFGVTTFSDDTFANDAPANPEQWDPRVEATAAFVENERGLAFERPVYVEFLTEQEYVDLFTADGYAPDSATVEYYDALSDLYDAAGLAVDFDLLAGENTVLAVSTLGIYSPGDDRIFIRGDELTPDVRAVLAHELVHALQAQHFDLTLGGPDDLALRSIIEADALRVEDVYMATFSDADREAALAGLTADASDEAALSDVPVALIEQRSAPYILGPLLVETAFAERGNAGVDTLLVTPPSEEILVDPSLFGTGQQDALITVAVPDGATVIEDPHPLSMIDMLAMFDAWLPWSQARGALDGWNGGGYASYIAVDGSACFAVDAAFDASPENFAATVTAWSAAAGSSATPTIEGQRVRFEACERGGAATTPPRPVIPMTSAIFIEHSVIQSLPNGAPDAEIAGWRCVARSLIDHPDAGPLLMKLEWTPEDEDVYAWVIGTIYPTCGVQPPAG